MKKESAISTIRKEIGRRDGFDCVPCRIVGYCDPKGRGWCGGIQLVSPDLKDAVYWRLDALRRDNASLRMHLSHFHGKDDNTWCSLAFSCACHNLLISTAIRDACEPYLREMVGKETPAFLEALALLPAEKDVSKKAKAKTRHAVYERQKAKAGGKRVSKQKRPAKETTPSGTKYKSSKWSWADGLPVLNHNRPE